MYDRSILTTEARNDKSVQPPYSSHHISERAMKAETMRIFHSACPQTRAYYDLTHDRTGQTEENWLIKWMLWHVFRYRDSRNRGRRRKNPSQASSISDSALDQPESGIEDDNRTSLNQSPMSPAVPSLVPTQSSSGSETRPFYDPVRDIVQEL